MKAGLYEKQILKVTDYNVKIPIILDYLYTQFYLGCSSVKTHEDYTSPNGYFIRHISAGF